MPDPLPRTPCLRLDGRRAVVTDAGRGIGVAAAPALAEAGCEVTLVARSQTDIAAAAAAIVASGGKAMAVALDVADLDAVDAFFTGQPAFDVLVNNAGTNRPKPMWDVTHEDFDVVLGINVKSAFFVAQACARRMIEAGVAGSLIHMGSQMGHVGGPDRSLYCASKWALEGLSKSFALDLAPIWYSLEHDRAKVHRNPDDVTVFLRMRRSGPAFSPGSSLVDWGR